MRGFGERVDTFFSPRMWHHAGRPTTGHSTETIEANSKHNRRRTIARLSWINKNSKREFLQKMNLIILLIKWCNQDWMMFQRIFIGQILKFWYHSNALNETKTFLATIFEFKNFLDHHLEFHWSTFQHLDRRTVTVHTHGPPKGFFEPFTWALLNCWRSYYCTIYFET